MDLKKQIEPDSKPYPPRINELLCRSRSINETRKAYIPLAALDMAVQDMAVCRTEQRCFCNMGLDMGMPLAPGL